MNLLVTVVVPACLRRTRLRACLLALSQQKLSLSQFEVIVVDRANDRLTALLTQDIAQQTGLLIRYVSQRRNRSAAAACNRGWNLANSHFVAFTQADCLPQPLWLTTALPLFHNGAQVIVGRVQHPLPNRRISVSAGTNLFCRRSLLDDMGGFDESLKLQQLYEQAWLDRLSQIDVLITSCPDAVVVRPGWPLSWLTTLRLTLSKLALMAA